MSQDVFIAVYGGPGGIDKDQVTNELSSIFGESVQPVDSMLGGPADVLGFVADFLKVNLEEVSRQLVQMVRRLAGMKVEIEVQGIKISVDGASSPDQLKGLLQMALASRGTSTRAT